MIFKQSQDEILGYLKDASNLPGGYADGVYFPETEQEIVDLMKSCSASGTPVTIAGAGTGLAGGRVPFGGVVLSMAKLNRIVSIDTSTMRAVVEPGVVLRELQEEVEAVGAFYPPDPTERNAFVGGTVATNASGARTFKYGPTRDYVTALRVVLSNGELVALRRGQCVAVDRTMRLETESGRVIELELPRYSMPPIKHAAGYYVRPDMDAIDLFIGSEGTLGVITLVEVRLIAEPERIFAGVVFFGDESATLDFVEEARQQSVHTRRNGTDAAAGIDARALEFIDAASLDLIRRSFPEIPDGARGGAVWFEQEVNDETEERLLAEWYELMVRHGAMADESWFAVGLEDQRRLREFRHAVPSAVYEHISEHGQTKLGTDMAVPDDRMRELLQYYREEFAREGLRNVTYGHIGNSHLHANTFASPSDVDRARALYARFVRRALEMGGTISAEHGVGKIKRDYLVQMYGEEAIESMKRIKAQLDPAGILGRGTMFI